MARLAFIGFMVEIAVFCAFGAVLIYGILLAIVVVGHILVGMFIWLGQAASRSNQRWYDKHGHPNQVDAPDNEDF